MPTYRYRGLDVGGQNVAGELEADDVRAAVAHLEEMGLQVQAIDEITYGSSVRRQAGTESVAVLPSASQRPKRLGRRDTEELAQHLASLTESNLPLASGLMAFADELSSNKLRRSLKRIADSLSRGETLDAALAAQKMPADLVALVRAGAHSGDTGLILRHYASNIQRAAELRRRLSAALGYPLVLLGISLTLVFAILKIIAPQFITIYDGFGTELPLMTYYLVLATNVVEKLRWPYLIAILAVFSLAAWLFPALLGSARRRWLLRRLPLIGRVSVK